MNKEYRDLIEKKSWKQLVGLLASLDPSDIAEILQECTPEERSNVLNSLTVEKATIVFEYLPYEIQENLINVLRSGDLSLLLNQMSPDDRTRLIEQLPDELITKVKRILTPEESKVADLLLAYDENSVGRYMTTDYFCVKSGMTVNQAFEFMRKYADTEKNNFVNMVYVIDQKGKFINEVNLSTLVLSRPDTKVTDLHDHTLITLLDTSDIEEAVITFEKYDRFTLPVIDRKGILVGIITADDIYDISVEEATEDIQKLGGMEVLDGAYFDISLTDMIKKRAGWLSVLFVGEMLTATAMSYFEDEIAKAVVLALFVPLIISSGGNSGSQATSLIIRSLALGEIKLKDWWEVFKREIIMGLIMGSILGLIGALRIIFWPTRNTLYGPHYMLISLTIAFSLVGVVTFGTISGSMLPFILRKVGFDPASASAPFVATLVDVTGLVIYFTFASIILKGVLL